MSRSEARSLFEEAMRKCETERKDCSRIKTEKNGARTNIFTLCFKKSSKKRFFFSFLLISIELVPVIED